MTQQQYRVGQRVQYRPEGSESLAKGKILNLRPQGDTVYAQVWRETAPQCIEYVKLERMVQP